MRFSDDLMLQTPRLVLRPLGEGDAEAFFQIQSDPAVMRYWNHAPWDALAQAQQAIAEDRQARAAGTMLRLGIRERATDRLLGTCLVCAIEPGSRRAEIGYNLAAAAQGQGYMAEALEHFITWLFGACDLRRLEAETDPRNTASGRVLTRLGFRLQGYLPRRWEVAGEISDSALFGLLREDRRPPGSPDAALDPDADLAALSAEALRGEIRLLRAGIRRHRDASGHDLCWYHPHLWALLPEHRERLPEVPAWPQFMGGCVAYRASLDAQCPQAPRTEQAFE